MRCDHCPIQGYQAERVTTTTLQPPIIRRWGKLHKMRITLNSLTFYRIILLITWARYPVRFKFPATCTPFIVPYPHHQQHRIWHRIEGHDAVRCDATNYSMRWGAMPKQHRLDAGGWRCWQPWVLSDIHWTGQTYARLSSNLQGCYKIWRNHVSISE